MPVIFSQLPVRPQLCPSRIFRQAEILNTAFASPDTDLLGEFDLVEVVGVKVRVRVRVRVTCKIAPSRRPTLTCWASSTSSKSSGLRLGLGLGLG